MNDYDYGNEDMYLGNDQGDESLQYSAYRLNELPKGVQRQKVLSLGINRIDTIGPSANLRSPPRDGASESKQDKHAKFVAQLEKDKYRVIEETRKPFVRKIDDMSEGKNTTLLIGNYMDEQTAYEKKKAAQRAYQMQLRADMTNKALSTTFPNKGEPRQQQPASTREDTYQQQQAQYQQQRFADAWEAEKQQAAPSAVTNRSRNPSSGYLEGYKNIGGDEEALRQMQRERAKEIQRANREEVMAKISRVPAIEASRQQYLSNRRSSREVEYDRYPTEGGFFIGADESLAKSKKKENQAQYYAALMQDSGGRVAPERNLGPYGGEYVEKTGWTSINVGSNESENTRSRTSLVNKRYQQDHYRAQLEEQQQIAYNMKMLDARENFDPSQPLPYMRY